MQGIVGGVEKWVVVVNSNGDPFFYLFIRSKRQS